MSGVDLATFLAARLDEREAAAKAATVSAADWIRVMPDRFSADATHIALNDPQFVLDDIAAKRRIMGRHRRYGEIARSYAPWDDACDGCGFPGDPEWPATEHINDCPELRDLAAPFAQHPDFDPAWTVEA